MTRRIVAVVLTIAVAAVVLIAAGILRYGISAREEPTRTEIVIARAMRRLAIPAALRNARNPVPLTAAALAEGRAHWADHCATCHANDGSGNTEIGRNLYPRAPDMRQPPTQELTDGELLAIIKNGVRLTGMPAWGDASGHDDADNWKLVLFIRHLPKVTPQELEEMKKMNPITPAELQEQREEEQFLKVGR